VTKTSAFLARSVDIRFNFARWRNKSERLLDMIAGIQTGSVELWNGRPECLSNRDLEPSGAFALINIVRQSKYYKEKELEASIEDPADKKNP